MTTVIEFRHRRSATDAVIARAFEASSSLRSGDAQKASAEIILLSLGRGGAAKAARPRKPLKRRRAAETRALAPA
jgi:hypothetical protein